MDKIYFLINSRIIVVNIKKGSVNYDAYHQNSVECFHLTLYNFEEIFEHIRRNHGEIDILLGHGTEAAILFTLWPASFR